MFRIYRRSARPESKARRAVLRFAAVLALAAVAPVAELGAQQNVGFEQIEVATGLPAHWSVAGRQGSAARLASDTDEFAVGQASLRVHHDDPAEFTRVVQRVAADALRVGGGRTPRLRLTGYTRAGDGAVAALWLRIDGAKGPLFADSQGVRDALSSGDTQVFRSGGWRRQHVELPLPEDVTEVAIGVSLRGAGTGWFDELTVESVATATAGAPAPAAARYLAAALELIEAHALNVSRVDWPALREQTYAYAHGATTPADAHLALRFAVRELGDRHSYLQSPFASRALEDSPVGNALTRAPLTMAEGRLVGERAAFVAVPGFAGGSHGDQVRFAERLTALIANLDSQGACGWVVDLRDNRGGNLWPMLVGLGPLFGNGDIAASMYPDSRHVAVWHRDGQGGLGDYVQLRVPAPYRLGSSSPPIAVLLGPGTASAAEVLAIGFSARPGARSFGAPTSGATSGTRAFGLADGATLVLAVAATADVAGRVYSGAVLPDEPVATARGAGAADTVLAAALDWLATARSCR